MAVSPTTLKVDAEKLLKVADTVLPLLEELPLPAEVKKFVVEAAAFVKDAEAFLGE